jgi:inosine/xanthosine triphosphate pyrophosphatase family protein
MKILLATNNQGKVERYKTLVAQTGLDIELCIPSELGIVAREVEENADSLAGNAELKARAYFGLVDMPILANDTGFYVEGEGLVEAPKREALGDIDERTLSNEDRAARLLAFWKGIATKYGGQVDAAWVEVFVVLYPNGTVRRADSCREVLLTDQEFGTPHLAMPVRALYYSKITNKPSIQHTEVEELAEMQPVIDALVQVL